MNQLPLLEHDGHPHRRDPAAIPAAVVSRSGLVAPFAAVDFGSQLHVSEHGELGTAARGPGARLGTTRYRSGEDFVDLVEELFAHGLDVVTEAPSMGSFGPRGHMAELVALLEQHPERHLFTIGSQGVRNELLRQEISYDSQVDHGLAAATIWALAARHQPKVWHPPNPAEAIHTIDPVRPNVTGLVQLRNDRYPAARMNRDVYPFLFNIRPNADQKRILNNGHDRAPDRCAALVWSLREPGSVSRRGWERVIGASVHGRPNIYRQMLIVGKPRKTYRHGVHFTGLSFTDATRALRGLRSMILADHPTLPGVTT